MDTNHTLYKRKERVFAYAVIFLFSVLWVCAKNWSTHQGLYIESPDGTLYLSIADNFLKTGHFIQTARPYEIAMVVPPGLPLIITLMKAVFIKTEALILLQYCLFGLTAVLLTAAADHIVPCKWVNFATPLMFVMAEDYVDSPNPGYVGVEVYMVFLLSLFFFLMTDRRRSSQERLWKGIVITFIMFMIRPALAGVLVLCIAGYLVQIFRRKWSWKPLVSLIVVFAVVLSANLIVNRRESGYWVMMENYSGSSIYLANNPNAKSEAYASTKLDLFADSYFNEIYFDESLNTHEKNQLLGEKARAFMLESPKFCVSNALSRYRQMFISPWNWNFYIFFLALVLYIWKKRLALWQGLLFLSSYLLISILTSFGLNILRYAVPAIPFYALMSGSLVWFCIETCISWMKKSKYGEWIVQARKQK